MESIVDDLHSLLTDIRELGGKASVNLLALMGHTRKVCVDAALLGYIQILVGGDYETTELGREWLADH